MNKSTFVFLQFIFFASAAFAQNFIKQSSNFNSLSFKENKGQVSDQFFKSRADILFSGQSGDLAFYLKSNGISYQLNRVDTWVKRKQDPKREVFKAEESLVPGDVSIYRLDVNWLNANTQAQIEKGETLPGYENYYLASCPDGALDVKSYNHLVYKNIYPGIDLKWYGKEKNLKYDYYVSANSDYKQIQLEIKGAESIAVNAAGELVIKTPLGTLKEQKPLVTQNNKPLVAKWLVTKNIVSFEIKNYDASQPMVIDPLVRLWGSYFGGPGIDDAYYIHSNPSGHVYMSGGTRSTANIATTGSHQVAFGGGNSVNNDAYLVKFNAAGVLHWATYYGGTGDDYACESIAELSGDVYLTGGTRSDNPNVIATSGAHQTAYSTAATNDGDAFLVKFNAHGIRVWGTYFGGDKADFGYGVSLNAAGDVFMTGGSYSTNNISTSGSHQPALAGHMDPFLAKLNSNGVLQWATYYGGSGMMNETAFDCVTDASGNTYITGVTSSSTGVSTPGSHQAVFGSTLSSVDAFLSKFDNSGVLLWGTYYGGNGGDVGNVLSLDASNNVYLCGFSNSNQPNVIATSGAHQVAKGGADDAFLVKFDPSGTRLWGTYYGGSGGDYGYSTSVDPSGNVYLVGSTTASTISAIATSCAYKELLTGGSSDGYIAKFTSSGQRLWGTYYGSIYSDAISSCSADAAGNIYVSGMTLANSGTVIATANGYMPAGAGQSDAFIVKFDGCIPGALTPPANLLLCSGSTTTLSAGCGKWYNSPTSTVVLGVGSSFVAGPITSDSTFYLEDFSCGSVFATRTVVDLTVSPLPTLTLTNSNPLACVSESVTLTASGAATYSWTGPSVSSTVSALQVFVLLQSTYSVTGTDANGCESDAIISISPNLCMGINEQGNISADVTAYPNPNNGEVNIRSASEVELVLCNELGQQVKTIHLSSSNNFSTTLKEIPNGIYFLSTYKGTKVQSQKIVVIN